MGPVLRPSSRGIASAHVCAIARDRADATLRTHLSGTYRSGAKPVGAAAYYGRSGQRQWRGGAIRMGDLEAPDRATATLDPGEVESQLEQHRVELTAYCYRMLGSAFEAEDAVQETLLRAWRGIDGFEGRASVRSWLYRIATNVCLDILNGTQRRARPMDLAAPQTADAVLGEPLAEASWIQPIPDGHVVSEGGDPPLVAHFPG